MARLRLGFRGRQIAAMTAVAAVVAVVTSALSAALMVRSSVDQILNGAELIGRTLYHQIVFVVRENWSDDVGAALASDPGLRRIADSVVGYSPVTVYVAILDDEGRTLFHSDPERRGEKAREEASLVEFVRRNAAVQAWMLATRSSVLALELPFSIEGQSRFGTVRVAVSTVLLRETFSGLIVRNAAFAAGVVLLAFGVSFFVADRMLAPVERLRAELASIDVGEGPLELRTEDDASRIAALFSSMARELRRRPSGEEEAAHGSLDEQDGVAVISTDGRVVMMNEAARQMVGPSYRAGTVGDPLDDLVRSAVADDRPVGPRRLALQEQRDARECLVHAWPMRVGASSAAVVLLRDAERLAGLAAELAHSRQLGAVGRIGAGVTHEVKNTLNAILMNAELLRRKLKQEASVSESVDVVEKELRRLGRMVETFLQFTRPEEIRLRRVELTRVIDDALDLVTGRLEATGIRLEFDAPTVSPVTVGDAEMLRQALLNLILNACDAMPDGGTLRVTATCDPESGDPVVSVEDTGVGIPADRLPRIFELFHSTKPDGHGIGLSTVYRIVHMHGGRVEADSEPGQGSRFTVRLPGGSA